MWWTPRSGAVEPWFGGTATPGTPGTHMPRASADVTDVRLCLRTPWGTWWTRRWSPSGRGSEVRRHHGGADTAVWLCLDPRDLRLNPQEWDQGQARRHSLTGPPRPTHHQRQSWTQAPEAQSENDLFQAV